MTDRAQVVKLAQPGIDVKTAGDDKLVYNSNWPLLKIYKSGTITITDTAIPDSLNRATIKVTDHDLGYVPMFWIFANTNLNVWNSGTGQTVDDRSDFNGPLEWWPVMTDSQLTFDYLPPFTGTLKFTYYIFALDITTNYQAPVIRSGGVVGPRNTTTVFKIAKEGKDISSPHLEDYIVNSRARSPLVHGVFHDTTKPDSNNPRGTGITYRHNLGYNPMFFLYVKTGIGPSGSGVGVGKTPGSYLLMFTSGGEQGITVDSQKIDWDGFGILGLEASIIVLKDPFSIDYSIPVTI